MARGTQFLTLIRRLRATLQRSTDVSVGVDDLPILKERLNQAYEALYLQNDWPHLRMVFTLTLQAGERYYDFPTGLDMERVEEAVVYFNDQPQTFERGIDFADYAEADSDLGERRDPALKWDVRWTGTKDQIEVWPVPATNGNYARFQGIRAISPLVNDTDVCLLDDTLIVLFAAAAVAPGGKNSSGQTNQQIAQDHLRALRGRGKGGLKRYRVGLGAADPLPASRITVRVSG